MLKNLIALMFIAISITACGEMSANAASVPTSTPNPIQDPQLLQAWEQLNALTEPVQLPDGSTLTGHALAQFVLSKNVPIVWDVTNVCRGNSCSVRFCNPTQTICSHQIAGVSKVQPIYLRVELKSGAEDLVVEAMAHEIFHRTEPFGAAPDTLYEEYLAFNLSARIAHTHGTEDVCANPMQAACLKHWFVIHGTMYGYTNLEVYPSSLKASIDTTSQPCFQDETTAAQPTPEAPITNYAKPSANQAFTVNAMGLPDFQNVTPTTTVP